MLKIAWLCFVGFMLVVTGSNYLESIGLLKKETNAQKKLRAAYKIHETKTPEEVNKATHQAVKTCLTQKAGGPLPEDYVSIWSGLMNALFATNWAEANDGIGASEAAERQKKDGLAAAKKYVALEATFKNETRQMRARIHLVDAALAAGENRWPYHCVIREMANPS